jgi:hypothetical protein
MASGTVLSIKIEWYYSTILVHGVSGVTPQVSKVKVLIILAALNLWLIYKKALHLNIYISMINKIATIKTHF